MPRALVRAPSPRLAEGLVTHIARSDSVDPERALAQWESYCAALRAAGFALTEVDAAPEHPDSVFIEDALLVVGDLAIVTAPGAPERAGEVGGARRAAQSLGLTVLELAAGAESGEREPAAPGEIATPAASGDTASHAEQGGTTAPAPGDTASGSEPVHLDGGDVLKVGRTLYVGIGGRTTRAGADALGRLVADADWVVELVPISKTLHLKSQVTALPDGTVVGYAPLVDDPGRWRPFLEVPEEEGAHVVALDDETVLMSDAAPRSADLFRGRGLRVITVDVSEFVKLEGCVTCLSVRHHPFD